jgi:peptidylprolyl isomerase
MTHQRQGNGLVKALIALAIFGAGIAGVLHWKKIRDEEERARSGSVTFAQQFEDSLRELKKTDLKVGDGAEAIRGAKVTIHYVGMLQDGTVFDSSIARNQTVAFPLGVAQALPAWDHGIIGMKVGGRRRLEAPPFLAYGQSGIEGAVPPNAPVIFEIDLLKVGKVNEPVAQKNRGREQPPKRSKEPKSKKSKPRRI